MSKLYYFDIGKLRKGRKRVRRGEVSEGKFFI